MTTQPLGQLVKIEDLRTAWENEAGDFTPWLASPDNLRLLGSAIGLELEPEDTEVGVGSFSADIVCRNMADDGSLVVIENQLGKTDHSHLGQILTYAAGLDAKTLVWIARSFTDEHRSAVDWLNRVSAEGLRIFAIEIELWRIGNSPMAPRFSLVAKPNDWTKAVREHVISGDPDAAPNLCLGYWQGFKMHLEEVGSKLQPQIPSTKYWTNFPIGRTSVHLTAIVSVREEYVAAKVYFQGSRGLQYYQLLEQQRGEIETELGQAPTWEQKAERQNCQINYRRDAAPSDRNTWSELHKWTREKLETLDRVFRKRIAALPKIGSGTARTDA